ncbi:MAG: hypothetical protein IJ308_09125 [Clostridia bacterium]|nr:hypothetical protein [Clostridia bacterium]MBQ7913876.1 hypothetical protein [Clostridia bacterium]
MKKNYKIGFWNYKAVPQNPEKDIERWVDIGFNLASSFEYSDTESDKQRINATLRACEEKKIETILFDSRARYTELKSKGDEVYKANIREIIKDFGSKGAFKFLFLGDEPKKEDLDVVAKAYEIVRKECSLIPFVNYFPKLEFEGYRGCTGFSRENFETEMQEHFEKVRPEIVSYDCYTQLEEFNPTEGIRIYFENLIIFSRLAKKFNAELWTSLLSVGHWQYKLPTEDDIRWQYSTATAFGVTGMMWFYLYQWKLEDNYRGAPIDLYDGKTPCYDDLRRQTKIFREYHAPNLENAVLMGSQMVSDDNRIFMSITADKQVQINDRWQPFVSGMLRTSAETDYTTENPVAVSLFDDDMRILNPHSIPFIVSKWEKDGECVYTVANLSQKKSGKIHIHMQDKNQSLWFAPGQMWVVANLKN